MNREPTGPVLKTWQFYSACIHIQGFNGVNMEMFLGAINWVNENWKWVGPLMVSGLAVLLVRETISFFRNLKEDSGLGWWRK